MFHQLPSREKRVPDPKIFYTKEYIEWLDNVGLEAMDDLVKANLKDDLFEEEQENAAFACHCACCDSCQQFLRFDGSIRGIQGKRKRFAKREKQRISHR